MTGSPPPALARLLSARDSSSREQAWAAFVETYSPLLISTGRRFGSDHDAAMDRYAYVLEELRRDDFSRLRQYAADERSRFTTWLVVVARRLCIDYGRKRYGRPRGETNGKGDVQRVLRKRLADFMAEKLDVAVSVSGGGPDPERQVRARELQDTLNDALRELPAPDRLLLAFRHEQELTAPEIARLMDFPSVFHVYRRLNALHGSLRETLEQNGVDGPLP